MIETWENRPISPPTPNIAPGWAVLSANELYSTWPPMRVGEPTLVYETLNVPITLSGAGMRASST